jgi:hypothetical protein
MTLRAIHLPLWLAPSSRWVRGRATLDYRLIIKHPETRQPVASMDFAEPDHGAAVARSQGVAGHLHGELWQGETCIMSLAPESVELAR